MTLFSYILLYLKAKNVIIVKRGKHTVSHDENVLGAEELGRLPFRAPFLHPISIDVLGSGAYYIRMVSGDLTRSWPLVIAR